MSYSTQLTTDFQPFEPQEDAAVHIINNSNSAGDELHLESTPNGGETKTTLDEYVNADMQSDGTLVDRIEPLPHQLRIEEVVGSWDVWIEAVNHPEAQFN